MLNSNKYKLPTTQRMFDTIIKPCDNIDNCMAEKQYKKYGDIDKISCNYYEPILFYCGLGDEEFITYMYHNCL